LVEDNGTAEEVLWAALNHPHAMTVTDLDIWRAANILLKRHRIDAATVASHRADDLLAGGDIEGHIVWKRIAAAVIELQRPRRKIDEALN
jgi:hypothetical protein